METRRTTNLPLKMGDMRHPRLSPDGRELAFHVIDPSGVMNVWTQPFDGTRTRITADAEAVFTRAVTPLTHFTSASGYVRDPAWSPRGNRIVFERALRTGGVWTIAAKPSTD
jgi:Tol biopolymer transport system component